VTGPGRRALASVATATALVVLGPGCSGDGADEGTGGVPSEPPAGEVAPLPSSGCGAEGTPVGVGGAVAEEKVTVATGEGERWYLRHLPPAHDGTTPVPLVVDLHSYTEGADVHAVHSGLGPYGDGAGFATVTPQGTGVVALWRPYPGSPDVAFVDQLLDHVDATLCVDRARVYVAGLSNGAMLASVLACELPDRIAAVAAVAGVTRVEGCDPARPVPVVAFHGTEDPFLDYDGGYGAAVAALPAPDGEGTLGDVGAGEPATPSPPVLEVLAAWAGRNGCDGAAPGEEPVAEDVTHLAFDCPAGAEVELYRVEGGGSTWPGAEMLRHATDVVGVTTYSISANDLLWDFFARHALRR
jgi:polyhydroxybutyrate depolymerase